MTDRSAGLLLHPTSLPGRFGIGDLGPSATRFLDWAAAAKVMERPLLIDGRNFVDPAAAAAAGFEYEGIGLGEPSAAPAPAPS